jgi:hypothetical protein
MTYLMENVKALGFSGRGRRAGRHHNTNVGLAKVPLGMLEFARTGRGV